MRASDLLLCDALYAVLSASPLKSLPTYMRFGSYTGLLGVCVACRLFLIFTHSSRSSTRWTFKVFGHDRVAVLNGGLPAWRAAGGPEDSTALGEEAVSAGAAAVRAADSSAAYKYQARLDRSKVRLGGGWGGVWPLAALASHAVL
jgi:thiosulfate/3-mercaptopyruvate sulfurtransferase